jgi:predicted AlkP superfamily phosphohydrolase/phosphomutase
MFYEPDNFPNVDPKEVKKYKDVIPNSYIEADKAIGQILSLLDENATVIIASDHGCRALSENRNTYDIRIERFLDILRINQKVVVARFGPGVYLHFQDMELMHKIANIIRNISLEETGEKLFYVKLYGEILVVTKAVWKINAENIKEDSIIDFADFGTYKIQDLFSKQKMKISGVHDREGIFIAAGPDIKAGSKPDNPVIYDLTPTILALMGFPVGKDMDGRVLTEIFKEEFLKENPVKYIESYEESSIKEKKIEVLDYEKIKIRLEGLGYI